MTEHQTRIELSYRETTKAAAAISPLKNKMAARRLWVEFTVEYNKAMAGGDRFVFTKATRRYLKALRELSSNAKG